MLVRKSNEKYYNVNLNALLLAIACNISTQQFPNFSKYRVETEEKIKQIVGI